MAEYVERKYTAAKLSVALAIAAMLGGLAARDGTAGATSVKGAQPHLSEGSITTDEIKNGSLLFEDFKSGEVYSQHRSDKKFLGQREAREKWLKIKDANNTFVKAESLNAYIKLDDANNTFVKAEDANKTFVKIEDAQHQFVNGDGKVMTGFASSNGGATTLLDVPGFVRAEGVPAVVGSNSPTAKVHLTNLGTTPVHYGTGGGEGVIAPGASGDVNLPQGGGATTMQLVSEEATPTIGTLTVNAFTNGPTTTFSAQILIGL
jgi:hypothetical protein